MRTALYFVAAGAATWAAGILIYQSREPASTDGAPAILGFVGVGLIAVGVVLAAVYGLTRFVVSAARDERDEP